MDSGRNLVVFAMLLMFDSLSVVFHVSMLIRGARLSYIVRCVSHSSQKMAAMKAGLQFESLGYSGLEPDQYVLGNSFLLVFQPSI